METMKFDKSYTFKSPRTQCFSIPSNIIYYANQNPISPKGLEKLQQTCKWFFGKNAILVVRDGHFSNNKWPTIKINCQIHEIHNFKAKFWFTEKLEFMYPFQNENETICTKIYRNNITSLAINYANLNIQEFESLISSNNLKTLLIINSNILDNEKNDIPFDDLLMRAPCVQKFRSFKRISMNKQKPTITNTTLKNLIDHKSDNSIEDFAISGYLLSPTLDPEIFCFFIKNAAAPKSSFRFYMDYSFPEQKAQFEATIKEMISKKWKNYKQKPFIYMYDSF